MIPNNTKSGIISIIRFSGEKKTLYFFSGLPQRPSKCQRGNKTALRGWHAACAATFFGPSCSKAALSVHEAAETKRPGWPASD